MKKYIILICVILSLLSEGKLELHYKDTNNQLVTYTINPYFERNSSIDAKLSLQEIDQNGILKILCIT